MSVASRPQRASELPVPARPAAYVALDLETGDAPESAVQRVLECWQAPANIKDAGKIESRRQEAEAKIRQRAALLDEAPILCVAVSHVSAWGVVFNGMDGRRHRLKQADVVSCGDERSMLCQLRCWLSRIVGPDTVLVGHHLLGFDLPKLRMRFAHHRLRLPDCLRPALGDEEQLQPAVDTMRLFGRFFSAEHFQTGMVSLDEVAQKLGLPRTKPVLSGADVPELYRRKKIREILTYCLLDAITVRRAYELLAGLATDLE